ncbi:hypothetical protein LCGC14_1816690 [marine sediment metagenome]|uniref:Uncharacterized protein n=1 Tax=marine sediment metagenome TaxID=412755 RepID=A0A0F9H889_9ZZZZ
MTHHRCPDHDEPLVVIESLGVEIPVTRYRCPQGEEWEYGMLGSWEMTWRRLEVDGG